MRCRWRSIKARPGAGFKLVEGRSIHKYTDESAVVKAAEAGGATDIHDRKLKTITALERQLSKKRFTDLLRDFVVKPAGKPSLVPTSDKRPALVIQSAASEFTAIK